MLRNLLSRQRWYQRTGAIFARDKPAMVMLMGVRYTNPAIAMDHAVVGDQLTVRIGSSDPRQLEEFAEDLDAVGVNAEWSPIRRGDPRAEPRRQQVRLVNALESIEEAEGRRGTGPSFASIIETMGRAAADVSPPTPASRRTSAALAETYQRVTGGRPPF